ncbi:hypothetical protein GALMADRAFT_207976 [Galerina marginata CBS 339.88]|uniref:DUF4100 domain-containing protein n=1 Tax=Galerina marginata (strain CBS 339.88) TaxID=685588 RepID=A0A067TD97_GALM3|nr:hypothetical protein GALMADRAFT_207976 [Galerina marginata CBS 339.88]
MPNEAANPSNNFFMPARGDRSAPTFDPIKPRELKHYFSDLEFLMELAGVLTEANKKKHATRYVSMDIADVWETLAEYKTAEKTYENFKDAVLKLYPGADDDQRYSLADLDIIIGSHQRLGLSTLTELADYYRQFSAVTTFLVEKERLSELDQKRAFIKGFPPALWERVSQRLQLKFPDKYPDHPYEMEKVHEAAQYVLHGTSTMVNHFTPPQSTSSVASEPVVKAENLAPLFTEFTKSILEILKQNQQQQSNSRRATNYDVTCNFCSGPHYIRDCKLVDEYQIAGKVKRNSEGKVVLPTGAFVPRDIPGQYLKDRIDEWHRRNPNQLAAGMMSAILLEAEIMNLKTQRSKFQPIIRTRGQKAREPAVEDDEDLPIPPEPSAAPKSVPPAHDRPSNPSSTDTNTSNSSNSFPEHPFRNAPDASYLPPQSRNVGAPDKATNKKSEPAYRTYPPIYDSNIASNVYNRSLDSPITLTQRELLSIAPEVRNQLREATTTKRNANTDRPAQANVLDEVDKPEREFNRNYSMPHSVALAASIHRSPPEGSLVVPDPIEMYYRSLRPGEERDPDRIVVAKESSALRSIFAIVDNSQKEECILDPGCQIVAMSEEICHDLALIYDPTIKLNMQSANGTVDQSLGLARNVPFLIGGLTFYMQVHIIRAPAYDILMGRPFDVLTRSIVHNFANEEQTITVCDPNTGRTATIPTLPRSLPRLHKCQHEGFQRSRI